MALRLWKQWFYRLGGVDDFESPPRCFEDQLLALKLKLCSGNKSHLHVRKEDWVVGSIHLDELFLPVLAIWMIWPATRMGICLLSTCLSGLGSSWLDGRSFGAGHRWTVAIVGWEQRVLGGILVCMVYVMFMSHFCDVGTWMKDAEFGSWKWIGNHCCTWNIGKISVISMGFFPDFQASSQVVWFFTVP